jgi:hypothetical protein
VAPRARIVVLRPSHDIDSGTPSVAEHVDIGLEFFPHFPLEGLLGGFAVLGAAPRQRSGRLVSGALRQHGAVLDRDAYDAVVETPAPFAEPTAIPYRGRGHHDRGTSRGSGP